MPFYALEDMEPARPAPGVTRRAAYLEHVMLTFFEFEAGAVVPHHSHPHEQITYVIAGALQFTLDGETRVLRAGEGACVPANAPHSAVALEPTRVLDGWSPIREDYR
jgi:quercetin dioxygenase-like cupin family protein